MKKVLLFFLSFNLIQAMIRQAENMPPDAREIHIILAQLSQKNDQMHLYALNDFVKSLYDEKYHIDTNAPSYPVLQRLSLLDEKSKIKKPLRGIWENLNKAPSVERIRIAKL